jgi:hypothetical protein
MTKGRMFQDDGLVEELLARARALEADANTHRRMAAAIEAAEATCLRVRDAGLKLRGFDGRDKSRQDADKERTDAIVDFLGGPAPGAAPADVQKASCPFGPPPAYLEQDAHYEETRHELIRDLAVALAGGKEKPATEGELLQIDHYSPASEAERRAWVLFDRIRECLGLKPRYYPRWPDHGLVEVERVEHLDAPWRDKSMVFESRDRREGDYLIFHFDVEEGGPCASEVSFYLSVERGEVDRLIKNIGAALERKADAAPDAQTEW